MIALIAEGFGVFLVGLVGGFGIGRIKNKAKLAAIAAEIQRIEAPVANDVKSVVTVIKSHL